MQPEQLGPYRIIRTLGRGGMGMVFEAINQQTEEPAAVKVLSAALADEPDFRQRFEAEIETLRKLRHPNIVRLFGFGEQGGTLFYAMELVRGRSLEQELQEGRVFQWREVSEIGIATCQALRHAHDRGIVHRDIKPANLLLSSDGVLKLSDFGIARLFGYSRLTAAGNVLGTVEYMAPEQADGRPASAKADLYSVGGVLFALLARRPPFRARSMLEMLEKHRSVTADRVGKLCPGVPPELDDIIAQLLEKDPDRRITNADLLARRLQAMLRGLEHQQQQAAERPVASTLGFDVAEPIRLRGGESGGPAETRAVDKPAPAATMLSPTLVPPNAMQETCETSAFQSYATAPPPAAAVASETRSAHFVRVEEEELDQLEQADDRHAIVSWQTWFLAGCLLAIGIAIWYFLRPPTADALYASIQRTTAEGTIDGKVAASAEIEEFLSRYSNDPRAEVLLRYQDDIDLYRMERRLERREVNQGQSLPVERAYIEAISYLRIDTAAGVARLEALVALYEHEVKKDDSRVTSPTEQYVELARRKLALLRRELADTWKDEQKLLESRLDRADEVETSDQARARRIREAVLVLYGDKPWAAEVVERAQKSLAAEGSHRP